MRAIAVLVSVALLCGCGKSDESMAKRAGGKVGETLTDFASGVGKGVDKQMAVNVELSDEVTKQGLSKTIAKSRGMDSDKRGISVYFIAKVAFTGRLVAKALNEEGQEIGRSVVDVEFTSDDAKYVPFVFDDEMDARLVQKYVVDIKK
jgi:hypothetical protein